MIDIGFTKLLLVGGIALVVIGPERLPRVARTLGALIGRAQRYVSEVKAEVSRSIDLESLNAMKRNVESAARDVEQSVHSTLNEATDGLNPNREEVDDQASHLAWTPEAGPLYERPKKNWRLKRGAMPQWYKRQHGVRTHVQSAAARVARFRPAGRR
ncbi:MAG: Sec-independent protein translocase protein TatB [Burkholderiales bacterium]